VEQQNTILVVDDEVTCITFLVHLLQKEFTVIVAKNGDDAIEMAVKHLPDLILLDVDMPGMTGYEVLTQLKAIKETEAIPAIFITSRNKPSDEEDGLRLGAVDYINKSCGMEIIRMRVRNQLYLINKLKHNV